MMKVKWHNVFDKINFIVWLLIIGFIEQPIFKVLFADRYDSMFSIKQYFVYLVGLGYLWLLTRILSIGLNPDIEEHVSEEEFKEHLRVFGE